MYVTGVLCPNVASVSNEFYFLEVLRVLVDAQLV